MNAIETGKREPTQQIFHKVVEPSLGNLKLDSYPHHHSVRLHTAFYPQQSHCQLKSESVELIPRPQTHPMVKQHGILPKITKKSAITKRSPSRSGSVGSVSQTKELPLLTSRSQDRGSHLVTRNTKKAMSVCSQYRYLGPSKALQSQSIGSRSEDEIKNEQVRRFEEEVKSLEHTRHLKRVSEIATYQHRLDRMYYMCGSRVPLHTKYSVDNEELEKLRAFSIARSQSRSPSARRSASGGRIHGNHGSFVSGTDNQSDPGLTIDIVAGTVIRSPRSDIESEGVGGDEGATREDGGEDATEERCHTAHLKSALGQEGDSSVHIETTTSADNVLALEGDTLKLDVDGAGEASSAHKTFVTEEMSQETDLPHEYEVDGSAHLKHESPPEQCPDNGIAPENEGKLSADNLTSSQMQEASEQLEEIGRTGGEESHKDGAYGLHMKDNHGHTGDGEEKEDDGDDEDVNTDSARDPPEDEEETSEAGGGSGNEGNTSDGVLKENQQELGCGLILDKTPYYATKKQIYNNTTFDNPVLKQFEDLATLSKGDENGPDVMDYIHSREDDGESFISNQSDAIIAEMEEGVACKDHLTDKLSSVGHLEDSALDEDLLEDQTEGATDWDNGIFGEVLNDEERKEKEEMKEKRQREKAAARERQKKNAVKEEKEVPVMPMKINLTDIYSFITARQRMIFQKKFQDLDVDQNGKLTLKELTQRMNSGVKKEELKEFMKVFDLNRDKTIDEREFVTVAALNDKLRGQEIQSENCNIPLNLKKLALHITAYKEIFEMTDQDRNGYLSLEEVMFVISVSVGTEIGTDKEILDYIFKNLDVNGSGSIDFIEFLSFIPFFLKLHQEIVGRPATVEDVMKANAAVKEALSRKH